MSTENPNAAFAEINDLTSHHSRMEVIGWAQEQLENSRRHVHVLTLKRIIALLQGSQALPAETPSESAKRPETCGECADRIATEAGSAAVSARLLSSLRRLVFAARTSGETAGADSELMAACEQAESNLCISNGIKVFLAAARAIDAQEIAYRDPRSGEETWSANGEDWHNYSDVEELIRETENDLCRLEAGNVVYVGAKHYHDPAEFVDHEAVLTSMNENAAQSDAGEWVDTWPDAGEPAETELIALLTGWARRHCRPEFYLVENIRTYTITTEDLDRARAPAGAGSEGGSHD